VPSITPTTIPTAQPFSNPTAAPLVTIYQTKGLITYLGQDIYSSDNSKILGTSYILFGKNYKYKNKKFPFEISLQSPHSRGFVSMLQTDQGGIRNDISTRSTTIIGDINGDKMVDLLIGYPMESKCLLFLGIGHGLVEESPSLAILGDINHGGGQLGWASFRIGDVNHDGLDEIVVSAVYAKTVYLIYGRITFNTDTVLLHEVGTSEACKIVGSGLDNYFGMALALVHDFDHDGSKEIAISAMRSSDGSGIVYLLFGGIGLDKGGTILLDQLIASNSKHLLRVIGPTRSHIGFSIAGIGDINRDGYDDLAIGSVPHTGVGDQMVYIIYGTKQEHPNNELYLSKLTEEDGFIVKGAGFLVQAVGDVNSDNIPDVMITHFSNWNSHGHAYVINFPTNVTPAPTFQPTSTPTVPKPTEFPSLLPTSRPSSAPSTSFSPTSRNSSSPTIVRTTRPSTTKPSLLPSFPPTRSPSRSPPTFILSAKPTITTKLETRSPSTQLAISTRLPTHYHLVRTKRPSFTPTLQPTINSSAYTTIYCPMYGRYTGSAITNNRFIITANNGTVELTGNEYGEAINIYALRCSGSILDVNVKNFRASTDLFDLSELSEFYSYHSLQDLTYSIYKDSLMIFFCYDSLRVKLSFHDKLDLQQSNFLFLKPEKKKEPNAFTGDVQVGVFIGFVVFLVVGYVIFDMFFARKHDDKQAKVTDGDDSGDSDEESILGSASCDEMTEQGRYHGSVGASSAYASSHRNSSVNASSVFASSNQTSSVSFFSVGESGRFVGSNMQSSPPSSCSSYRSGSSGSSWASSMQAPTEPSDDHSRWANFDNEQNHSNNSSSSSAYDSESRKRRMTVFLEQYCTNDRADSRTPSDSKNSSSSSAYDLESRKRRMTVFLEHYSTDRNDSAISIVPSDSNCSFSSSSAYDLENRKRRMTMFLEKYCTDDNASDSITPSVSNNCSSSSAYDAESRNRRMTVFLEQYCTENQDKPDSIITPNETTVAGDDDNNEQNNSSNSSSSSAYDVESRNRRMTVFLEQYCTENQDKPDSIITPNETTVAGDDDNNEQNNSSNSSSSSAYDVESRNRRMTVFLDQYCTENDDTAANVTVPDESDNDNNDNDDNNENDDNDDHAVKIERCARDSSDGSSDQFMGLPQKNKNSDIGGNNHNNSFQHRNENDNETETVVSEFNDIETGFFLRNVPAKPFYEEEPR
jgi:hypothetical protein